MQPGFVPVQPSETAPQPAQSQPQVGAAITQLAAATATPTLPVRPVGTSAPTGIPAGKPGAAKVIAKRTSGADLDGGVFTVRDRQVLRDLVGSGSTPDEHLPIVRAFEAALGDQQNIPVPSTPPATIQPIANTPIQQVQTTAPTYVPASAQPLPQQLAAPLLKLRAGGDGSHLMIIALHPAELGPVDVHVRITGDAMTIQLAGGQDAHDTLRDALPQLRQELQSAGLSSVGLSLNTESSASQYNGNPGNTPRQAREQPMPRYASPEPTRPSTPRTHTSTGLDRWL